jgi:hypothetical protein
MKMYQIPRTRRDMALATPDSTLREIASACMYQVSSKDDTDQKTPEDHHEVTSPDV